MNIQTGIKALTCATLFSFAMISNAADPTSAPAPATTADDAQAVAAYEAQLQKAVEKVAAYPKEAVLGGEQGAVVVEFDYAGDGKATNVTLGATTASGHINRAAVRAVEKATLPPKPPELVKVSHFHIKLTYTLGH
jgi:TonB family protein